MQTDRTPNTPPTSTSEADDDEFSGLHDLKELANSARARSRRATSQGDSEIASLASTSASFKAVALPTSKTDLGLKVVTPSAVALAPKGSVPAQPPLRAQGTRVDQVFGAAPPAGEATIGLDDRGTPSAAANFPSAAQRTEEPVAPVFGASVATRDTISGKSASGGKKPWFAIGGILAATALGGVWWAAGKGTGAPAPAAVAAKAPTAPAPVAEAPALALEPVAEAPAPAVVQAPEQHIDVGGPAAKDKAVKPADAPVRDAATATPALATEPTPPAPPKVAATTGDKSIDDLLSDASSRTGMVERDAEQAERKIERTELSRSDIKKAFGAVSPAASACYKKHKEAGTVPVRVTVMPSGKVTKVVAAGAFAGTPTGDCVIAAAQGASFPEWDGSQTTLSYSFLLGE